MSADLFEGHSKVQIEQLRITSFASGKSADIRRIVKGLEIYQSIFDATMVASLYVEDNSGILYDLPLIGEEVVSVSFKTPYSNTFQHDFLVYMPGDINRDANQQKQHMDLQLVSLEHLRGISSVVEQGYKKTLSDIATDVLKNQLKTNKKLNIEPTKGVETLIIPNWDLWQTMEFLRQRAVSNKYSSPFVFYEDNDSWNFASIEYLVEQKKSKPIVEFSANSFRPGDGDDPAKTTVNAAQYRNVENFFITKKSNSAQFINHGGAMNRTQVFNLLQKSCTDIDLDYNEFAQNVVKQPLEDKFNLHHSSGLASIMTAPKTRYAVSVDDTNPTEFAHHVGKRRMFNQHMAGIEVSFTAYGDSQLAAGDLIKLKIPRTSSNADSDAQLDGLFIVSRVRHKIMNDNMYSDIEAMRYGFAEPVL